MSTTGVTRDAGVVGDDGVGSGDGLPDTPGVPGVATLIGGVGGVVGAAGSAVCRQCRIWHGGTKQTRMKHEGQQTSNLHSRWRRWRRGGRRWIRSRRRRSCHKAVYCKNWNARPPEVPPDVSGSKPTTSNRQPLLSAHVDEENLLGGGGGRVTLGTIAAAGAAFSHVVFDGGAKVMLSHLPGPTANRISQMLSSKALPEQHRSNRPTC